ncbi:hypothetical protein K469DRAFT_705401, partial [Zopfia rhizophila CBS 207.26]
PGRFLKRHDYSIFSKWTDGMDKERKRADSAFKYTLYFDLLERKIAQYNDFDPLLYKCYFTSSPSGWTNEDIGYAWLTQVFDRETKEKT